ncbi:MmcQ/YjbR family DNA-binding protein [Microbacterium sp. NPDC028030]|uniref:MmcQ/YjbR family DNA-binding protein n=1 Tax=Microbacterium sp. NPDC028030 TaxID=3155124 RepID=UPI0033E88DF3
MGGKTLQQHAAERAEELPGAEMSHPFGAEWDVYKVRGKVFMLQTATTGTPIVTLKSAPEDARALRSAHPDITPGYHMNKKHWITLHPGGGLDADLIRELVTESYLLVLENSVPKSQWPVDPRTFGQEP